MTEPDLTGRCILIGEDEHIVARSLGRVLERWGAVIVGPAPTVESALALLRSTARLDGAVVDVNLRGVMAYPVADALIARAVPLVFTSGYAETAIPEGYRSLRMLQKPFDPADIAGALFSGPD